MTKKATRKRNGKNKAWHQAKISPHSADYKGCKHISKIEVDNGGATYLANRSHETLYGVVFLTHNKQIISSTIIPTIKTHSRVFNIILLDNIIDGDDIKHPIKQLAMLEMLDSWDTKMPPNNYFAREGIILSSRYRFICERFITYIDGPVYDYRRSSEQHIKHRRCNTEPRQGFSGQLPHRKHIFK